MLCLLPSVTPLYGSVRVQLWTGLGCIDAVVREGGVEVESIAPIFVVRDEGQELLHGRIALEEEILVTEETGQVILGGKIPQAQMPRWLKGEPT